MAGRVTTQLYQNINYSIKKIMITLVNVRGKGVITSNWFKLLRYHSIFYTALPMHLRIIFNNTKDVYKRQLAHWVI